jgi:hypothetical protein
VCKGRHTPASILDDIVVSNLKARLFTPDRLAELLQGLVDRQTAKTRRSMIGSARFRRKFKKPKSVSSDATAPKGHLQLTFPNMSTIGAGRSLLWKRSRPR